VVESRVRLGSGRVRSGHNKLTDVELHIRETVILDEIMISFLSVL
jgi:hypothetical protein